MYARRIMHEKHTMHKKFYRHLTHNRGGAYNGKRKRTRPTGPETEAENMTQAQEPITLDTLERLEEMQEGLDALELMIDAYILGPGEYEPRRAANAMQGTLDRLREQVRITRYETQTALAGLKMA